MKRYTDEQLRSKLIQDIILKGSSCTRAALCCNIAIVVNELKQRNDDFTRGSKTTLKLLTKVPI
jgi:hypothetical protein